MFRLLFALFLACAAPPSQAFDPTPDAGRVLEATGTVTLAFTPEEDATGLLVRLLDGARREVRVQAYSFTSRALAAALIRAHRRGVTVEVVADAEQAERISSPRLAELVAAGVPVLLDAAHTAAHNKVMVLDPGTPAAAVVTGSFNFTYGAQKNNAENLLVFRDAPALTAAYLDNWRHHRAHARPMLESGRSPGTPPRP